MYERGVERTEEGVGGHVSKEKRAGGVKYSKRGVDRCKLFFFFYVSFIYFESMGSRMCRTGPPRIHCLPLAVRQRITARTEFSYISLVALLFVFLFSLNMYTNPVHISIES